MDEKDWRTLCKAYQKQVALRNCGQIIKVRTICKAYQKQVALRNCGQIIKVRTICKAYQKQVALVWIVFIDVTLKQMYYFEMNDALVNAAQTDAGKTYFPISMSKVLIPVIGDVSMAKLRIAAAYTPKAKGTAAQSG